MPALGRAPAAPRRVGCRTPSPASLGRLSASLPPHLHKMRTSQMTAMARRTGRSNAVSKSAGAGTRGVAGSAWARRHARHVFVGILSILELSGPPRRTTTRILTLAYPGAPEAVVVVHFKPQRRWRPPALRQGPRRSLEGVTTLLALPMKVFVPLPPTSTGRELITADKATERAASFLDLPPLPCSLSATCRRAPFPHLHLLPRICEQELQ